MNRITLPPADKPIGHVVINGRQFPVLPDRTWLQVLEAIVKKLNAVGG